MKWVKEEGVADSSGITPELIGSLKFKVDDLKHEKSSIDSSGPLAKKEQQIN